MGEINNYPSQLGSEKTVVAEKKIATKFIWQFQDIFAPMRSDRRKFIKVRLTQDIGVNPTGGKEGSFYSYKILEDTKVTKYIGYERQVWAKPWPLYKGEIIKAKLRQIKKTRSKDTTVKKVSPLA